jgi:S1-C subfamily serine protease
VQVPPGNQAELTVWRDGKEQALTATTAQWPGAASSAAANASAVQALKQNKPDAGVKLAPLSDAMRKQYSIDPKVSGVVVTSVERIAKRAISVCLPATWWLRFRGSR